MSTFSRQRGRRRDDGPVAAEWGDLGGEGADDSAWSGSAACAMLVASFGWLLALASSTIASSIWGSGGRRARNDWLGDAVESVTNPRTERLQALLSLPVGRGRLLLVELDAVGDHGGDFSVLPSGRRLEFVAAPPRSSCVQDQIHDPRSRSRVGCSSRRG